MEPATLVEKSAPGRESFVTRFVPICVLVGVLWTVFVVNNLILGGHLNRFGLIPRHISGLPGILLAPFLHGSFAHLAANSIPLLILGAVICARGKGEFGLVTFGGIFLGGVLTWMLGRNAYHIGASGLIFCYFGYLASLAYFKRSIVTLLLSVVCIVGYGGMLRGILPGVSGVSWEGHLAGFISGIGLAWAMSRSKDQLR